MSLYEIRYYRDRDLYKFFLFNGKEEKREIIFDKAIRKLNELLISPYLYAELIDCQTGTKISERNTGCRKEI